MLDDWAPTAVSSVLLKLLVVNCGWTTSDDGVRWRVFCAATYATSDWNCFARVVNTWLSGKKPEVLKENPKPLNMTNRIHQLAEPRSSTTRFDILHEKLKCPVELQEERTPPMGEAPASIGEFLTGCGFSWPQVHPQLTARSFIIMQATSIWQKFWTKRKWRRLWKNPPVFALHRRSAEVPLWTPISFRKTQSTALIGTLLNYGRKAGHV